MLNLKILRAIIISLFSFFLFAMCRVPSFARRFGVIQDASRLVWPIFWLLHYLRGSGEAMPVPTDIVRQGEKVFLAAISESNDSNGRGPVIGSSGAKYRPYCVYHSTLYDGKGFHGRPTLFYLLGGFTFRLYPGKYWEDADGEGHETLVVSGNDRYDWHANEDGRFFSSPIGSGFFAKSVIKIAGFLFGEKYFLEEGSPFSVTGEMGISNELWHDMKHVGAREFNSYFTGVEICLDGLTYAELEEVFDPEISRDWEYEDYDEEEGDDYEEYDYED
jgi:hypothetical protein